MFTTVKQKLLALAAVAGLVAISTVAYAYWTAGGSGSGSASAGTTTPLTAKQSSTLTAMYPGDSAQTISGTFDNPNPGPIYVTSVTVSVGAVTKAAGAEAGTCDATDFTVANATMTVGAEVAAGTSKGTFSGATIKFNNKATNQDACKNATVALSYSIT